MRNEPVMIDDARVVAIEIVDCGELLVDTRSEGVRVPAEHPRATSPAKTRFWCRESVLTLLKAADDSLPDGIDLVLTEGHRPLDLQRTYWEADLQNVRDAHPELSAEAAAIETAKYVAPPWIVPPHSTGGAVDVILFAGDDELPMGCELNEQCPAMRTEFDGLTRDELRNRRLLVDTMTSVGFVNYGHEWWHYSYGDRYWAFATGADTAIYTGL